MTALPMHRYYKDHQGKFCGVSMPSQNRSTSAPEVICARPEDHPIHDIDNIQLEELTRALSSHRWVPGPEDSREEDENWKRMAEHRNHYQHSECAICTRDVHAIAAFTITYLQTTQQQSEPAAAATAQQKETVAGPAGYRGWQGRLPAGMPPELIQLLNEAFPGYDPDKEHP